MIAPAPPPFPELPATRAGALAALRRAFAAAAVGTPDLDARLILLEALGIDPVELLTRPGERLTMAEAERLDGLARRRLAREPVARILGRREFWGLPFALSPGTLEPRPDTEVLVETALARLPDRGAAVRLLDLGTGSGCLLVALLSELPEGTGIGVDRSLDALATARRNAFRNGVGPRARFVAADWAAPVAARFDLVVSNPPYIRQGELPALAPEVRHDPVAALDGGPDGLDAYRAILAEARRLLASEGFLAVEIGHNGAEAVAALAWEHGLAVARIARDLGGRPRVLVLRAA
jgi:release factor glutamine methyltransferase